MVPGNLDVWTEILQHLHISVATDQKEVVGENRRAILCIALLSPTLTSIALEYLWQSMSSLEPIRQAINSYCSSEQEQLGFLQNNQGGYWVSNYKTGLSRRNPMEAVIPQILQNPLSPEQRIRALDYLSHIQDFYFRPAGIRETTLWSILSVSLGLGSSMSLVPNLKTLTLDLENVREGVASWLHSMAPLMSPSLERLFYKAQSPHVGGVEVFQALLKSQSIDLTSIDYRGYPSPSILERFLLFDGLESLILDFNFEGRAIQRYTQSTITVVDIFDKIARLKDLRVDLRLFPIRASTPPGKSSKAALSPMLRCLQIIGDASDLQEFFLYGVTSSSLSTLTISIAQAGNLLAWKPLCDQASASFPQMRSLTLQAQRDSGVPQLLMQDISSIISRTAMESFKIDTIPHCFTDAIIPGLVTSWPNLKTLCILNNYDVFLSARVLLELSRLPHLQHLALPLNLTELQAPLPLDTLLTDCPLKELRVTKYSNAPAALDGTIDLARNVLMLFPVIREIFGDEPAQQTYLGNLQKLLRAFHSTIAIQAHRRAPHHKSYNKGITTTVEVDNKAGGKIT